MNTSILTYCNRTLKKKPHLKVNRLGFAIIFSIIFSLSPIKLPTLCIEIIVPQIAENTTSRTSIDLASFATQINGNDPINTHVYFVHGYNGKNSQFDDLVFYLLSKNLLDRYASYRYFDYFERGQSEGLSNHEIHEKYNISDYAYDFSVKLANEHQSETQIDIVAHSLGGLITREMLRLYREQLQNQGIEIGRIITLGTPHTGIQLTKIPLLEIINAFSGNGWYSPILDSINPRSSFLQTLNTNPENYSEGIEWYTVAGICNHPIAIFTQGLLGGVHDGLIEYRSASAEFKLSNIFSPISIQVELPLFTRTKVILDGVGHDQLINDPHRQSSYPYLDEWLQGEKYDDDGNFSKTYQPN